MKNNSFLIAMFFAASIFALSETASATDYLIGDQTINTPTTWANKHIVITGNLNIVSGGVLNLIDNSILEMNLSTELQYEIKLTGTGQLIINDSTITSYYKPSDHITYGNTRNSRIHLISGTPSIQVNNGTFTYLGTANLAIGGFLKQGAIIVDAGTDNYIRGANFDNVTGVVSVFNTAHINVNNTRLTNSGSTWTGGAMEAYVFSTTTSIPTYIQNNFVDGYWGTAYEAQPLYFTYGFSNWVVDNFTYSNLYMPSAGSIHQINLQMGADNFIMKNIVAADGTPSSIKGIGITFNSPGNNNKNGYLDNLWWDNPHGTVLSIWEGTENVTINNIRVTNASSSKANGIYVGLGGIKYNIRMTNMSYYGNSSNTIVRGIYGKSIFKHVTIIGTSGRTFWWTSLSSGDRGSSQKDQNNVYENFTLYGSSGGEFGSCPVTLLCVDWANNDSFIDWNLTRTNIGSTIGVTSTAFGNRFINVNDEDKVSVSSGGLYEKYHYVDILVKDQSGNPVPSATVTIANDINPSYPSINRNGQNKTTFTTGPDGHTARPLIDDSNTPVIMDYLQTSSGTQQMTHTITAEKNSLSASVSGINPNSTWYRTDPRTATNTVVITLPLTMAYGNITGTVANGTNPVQGATVATGLKTALTDASGSYTLSNVQIGQNTVTAAKAGYSESQQTVTVNDGQTATANFILSAVLMPAITSYNPTTPALEYEGNTSAFSVSTSQAVTSSWFLDNSAQSSATQSYSKTWSYSDSGIHNITYVGDNSNGTASMEWSVNVINVTDIIFSATGAISVWHFDESSGNLAYDSSGSNNGTIYGVSRATGKIGNALLFDGISNYVNVPDSNSMDFTNFTHMLWFKTTETANKVVIEKGPGNFFMFSDDPYTCSGKWSFGAVNTAGNRLCLNAEVNDNIWHHVAFSYTNTNASVYIDGALASTIDPLADASANGNPLTIGGRSGTYSFNGTIDEVKIYSRALSTAEILAEYNAGNAPQPSCSDSLQNQGETGVDCGGPCTACPMQLFINVNALKDMYALGEWVELTN